MLFNIFKIFAHKIERRVDSLVSTKDKIEEIRYNYDNNAKEYIKKAENLLVTAKQLKNKFKELDDKTKQSKQTYETLIKNNNLEEAKVKYIIYKGVKTARDNVETVWKNTENRCRQVRNTLKNIDVNKALIDARLVALDMQIDAMNICDQSDIGDFGVDCNAMIAEVEKEVMNTQFHIEAKGEIDEIMGNKKVDENSLSVDTEFEEIVKSLQA